MLERKWNMGNDRGETGKRNLTCYFIKKISLN